MPRQSKFGNVNQTGRKKLNQTNFTIKVDYDSSPPEIMRGEFELNLPETVDDDSIVIIDVYNKDTFQSFTLGEAGSHKLPKDLSLGEIGHNPMRFQLRVVHPDPDRPGVMSWRSTALSVKPPKVKPYETSQSTFQLLSIEPRTLPKGVPTDIEFPPLGDLQTSVKILVNIDECSQLYNALMELDPQVTALLVPPCLHAIAERLAAEASNETFDPSDPIVADSQWQDMWNALLKTWAGRGLQDIDFRDGAEVSAWASDVVEYWSTMSGNPANSVSRMLGGY